MAIFLAFSNGGSRPSPQERRPGPRSGLGSAGEAAACPMRAISIDVLDVEAVRTASANEIMIIIPYHHSRNFHVLNYDHHSN
jgi:hypothetical protein